MKERIVNIPNALTLFRVVSVPIFIFLWTANWPLAAFTFMILGFVSDFFDGRLARALSQETHFGAIFDPIADKICTLFYIPFFAMHGDIPVWYAVIVVLRNFSQLLSIPILIWWLKRTFFVKPKLFAKWGTALPEILLVTIALTQVFSISLIGFEKYKLAALLISSCFEIVILVTYLPRLVQIATGKHDTFE